MSVPLGGVEGRPRHLDDVGRRWASAIGKSDAGPVVIEQTEPGGGPRRLHAPADRATMRGGRDGTVAAHPGIGEAETSRAYWSPAWAAGPPSWPAEPDPNLGGVTSGSVTGTQTGRPSSPGWSELRPLDGPMTLALPTLAGNVLGGTRLFCLRGQRRPRRLLRDAPAPRFDRPSAPPRAGRRVRTIEGPPEGCLRTHHQLQSLCRHVFSDGLAVRPTETWRHGMRGTVRKWGNSAAVRLPAAVMQAARLELDTPVEARRRMAAS